MQQVLVAGSPTLDSFSCSALINEYIHTLFIFLQETNYNNPLKKNNKQLESNKYNNITSQSLPKTSLSDDSEECGCDKSLASILIQHDVDVSVLICCHLVGNGDVAMFVDIGQQREIDSSI